MKLNIKKILKNFINVFYKKSSDFIGPFSSWKEALIHSKGYDSDIIFEKTKSAFLKLKNNDAVYERDSVLFDKIEYSWPVLAGLMWATIKSNGYLNVIDFGGSLGSTYYQNKLFLNSINKVSWNIVEQSKWVEYGKVNCENEQLKFYSTIEDCLNHTKPNVILLSGVLQYLENPYLFIQNVINFSFDYIIIDRTLFNTLNNDEKIMVQIVNESIFEGSYPCYIFTEKIFLNYFYEKYDLITDFTGFKEGKGFIFQKKGII